MKDNFQDRWALANVESAVIQVEQRHAQHISCVIDPLGEYSRTAEQAEAAFQSYIDTIKKLSQCDIPSSLAVKPSAIGINFDRKLATDLMLKIFDQAGPEKISIEIDIEGTPTVEAICQLARECATSRFKSTLALQAYLERTADDIKMAIDSGIRVRLVKGAYKGDTEDFSVIQQMFLKRFFELNQSGAAFDLGTHDPDLLQQITRMLTVENRQKICFGFLKGLADNTKIEMARNGFIVSEYVPFGNNRKAYETRRMAYLSRLAELNRNTAP